MEVLTAVPQRSCNEAATKDGATQAPGKWKEQMEEKGGPLRLCVLGVSPIDRPMTKKERPAYQFDTTMTQKEGSFSEPGQRVSAGLAPETL